jgi:hypothetical protein
MLHEREVCSNSRSRFHLLTRLLPTTTTTYQISEDRKLRKQNNLAYKHRKEIDKFLFIREKYKKLHQSTQIKLFWLFILIDGRENGTKST